MKKTILFLAAAFALAVVGCSKKQEDADKKEKKAKTQKDKDKTEKPAPREVEKQDPAADEPEEAAAPEPAKDDSPAEAVLTAVKGTVEVRKEGADTFAAAAAETEIQGGDTIRAGKDGEATITFWDHSTAELTPESALTVDSGRTLTEPAASATLLAGAAQFDVTQREEGQGPFSVYTPAAVTAVQGTVLAVGVGLSGTTRVGVEKGQVEVIPVANLEAKPTVVKAGKAVEIKSGEDKAARAAYSTEKADWDGWLEKQDASAAQAADAIAKKHAELITKLNKDAEDLAKKEKELAQKAAELEQKIAELEKKKKEAEYKKIQPQFADELERVDAVKNHYRLVNARVAAHAYLLALLRARAEAGVYKVPPPRLKQVNQHYASVGAVMPTYWQRRHRRRLRHRKRMRRLRRAYYLHHPEGRAVAPAVGIEVPKFYKRLRLKRRRRARRRRIKIAGWKRPIFRRPRYRGKRLKRAKARRRWRRTRNWYKKQQWRKKQKALRARRTKRRARWRKAVIARRRKRWKKRPKVRPRGWRIRRRRRKRRRRRMGTVKVVPGKRRVRVPGKRRRRPMGVRVAPGKRRRRPTGVRVAPGKRRRKALKDAKRRRIRRKMRRRKAAMAVRKHKRMRRRRMRKKRLRKKRQGR